MTPEQSQHSIDIAIEVDEWIPTSAIATGIDQTDEGQLTRLYFESYGDPASTPGEPDGDSGHWRTIVLRAVEYITFTNDNRPTVIFKGETGKRFVLTAFSNVRDYGDMDPVVAEILRREDEHESMEVLAIQDNDQLIPIGTTVSMAIPDNKVMSPHLSRESKTRDNST